MAGTLDRDGQLTLMLRAGTGHAARQDLRTFAQEAAESGNVFIIDVVDLIGAEDTNLSAFTRTLRAFVSFVFHGKTTSCQ